MRSEAKRSGRNPSLVFVAICSLLLGCSQPGEDELATKESQALGADEEPANAGYRLIDQAGVDDDETRPLHTGEPTIEEAPPVLTGPITEEMRQLEFAQLASQQRPLELIVADFRASASNDASVILATTSASGIFENAEYAVDRVLAGSPVPETIVIHQDAINGEVPSCGTLSAATDARVILFVDMNSDGSYRVLSNVFGNTGALREYAEHPNEFKWSMGGTIHLSQLENALRDW